MPITSWKYIGVLDWQDHHSKSVSFTVAELELVIQNGLSMLPFYEIILQEVTKIVNPQSRIIIKSNITVPGHVIVKILDIGCEHKTRYDEINLKDAERKFPYIFDSRYFEENR